jgi:outer membrane receptor protein involved in Fe transport
MARYSSVYLPCAVAAMVGFAGIPPSALAQSQSASQPQGTAQPQSTAQPPSVVQPASGTKVFGRILDAQGGLPVTGATVELDRGATKVATTTTDANGNFAFQNESPGAYSLLITAVGYQRTRSADFEIAYGESQANVQTAIFRGTSGLKTIAHVASAGKTALQTTSTINASIDTALIQDQGYQRSVDALITVPGVINQNATSAAGDDMNLSIRGFDSTETATLLDGHPVGPVGAFGNGYNYNVSPFWGLSAADVIFGSGASGLFGATTIAGAVNFQTVDPTRQPHFSITQGVGSDNKLMTGLLATGTLGKLGYAIAWGTQGTTGNFPGANITQTALLQNSVVHPPYCPTKNNCNPPPPDLTTENVNNYLNTYWVTGQYSQKNFVGKLRYDFTPRTQFQFTVYSATYWSNATGNGDNDYQSYPYVLYSAQQTIAGGQNTILVDGKPETCKKSIAVLVNASPGYTCMNATQYAQAFYGPFGGGVDKWKTAGNQDYDARLTQTLGIGQITLEGFADAYNFNEQKGPGAPLGTYTTYGPGPNYLDLYHNRGFLLSDDFTFSKNDLAFGYTWLHQSDTNGQYPYFLPDGTQLNVFGNNPPLYLATASYFARDTWTPNDKLQAFGTFWVQRSLDTASTHVDPRLSVMYRPDSNDVIRVAAGRSYSEPDPSLIALAPPVYSAPSSINCPPETSGPGSVTAVATIANPGLQPETSNDLELALGHRFSVTTNVQADLYQTWENGALLNGLVPIVGFPGVTVPAEYVSEALTRLSKCAGLHPTVHSLGFQTTFNASGARYRGIDLSANVGLRRYLSFTASYAVTSAAYIGIPQSILFQNINVLDGGQIWGVPLWSGDAGLSYETPRGFDARIDATYTGPYNSWNRGPFWYANGNVSQVINSHVTVNLGVHNIFDSAAQQYGLIGSGVYEPVNYYGTAAQGGPTSAIEEAQEAFGLLSRQYWFTVKLDI